MPTHAAPRLTQLYSRHAPRWQHQITRLGYDRAYDHLLRQLPPRPAPMRVLDIGTGTGAFAAAYARLAPANCQFTLADPNPAMLAEARRSAESWRQPVRLKQAGIGAPLGRFDLILCAHVLEHLDIIVALRWLHQSLAPGGWLVLALSRPHWCTTLLRWRWGHQAYHPAEASQHLHQSGFTHIQPHPFPSGPPSRTSHGYLARP